MNQQDSDDLNQYVNYVNTGRYPTKNSNSYYRFNSQSDYNKRPSSQWNKNKNSMRISFGTSSEKNEQRLGYPAIYTSNCFHNTANLYLNKKNFTYAPKPKTKQHSNEYYEKEQLFDRVMKLQTELNTLKQKYKKKVIENDKCVKEINKQNKLLNSLNFQNFKEEETKNYYNQNDAVNDGKYNQTSSRNSENNVKLKINKKKYVLPEIIDEENEKEVKKLFDDLIRECEIRDSLIEKINGENENLKKINENMKIANETLVSNLKTNCKNLEKENEKKSNEISELKKNSKCSRYNELLKEKDIYEEEMNNIKTKLNDALNKVEYYKSQESEIKKLNDIIKKRDFKIKALELQLTTLSNNSDETTQKLQKELKTKENKIKKQEREMRKDEYKRYAYEEEQHQLLKSLENPNEKKTDSSENISGNEVSEKYPELYHIYIEMKKKGINSSKFYTLNVLKRLNEITSLTDNKIIYSDSLINIFDIKETEQKKYILNLADKEFISNKNLPEIKRKQIKILDSLFTSNKQEKTEKEIKKMLKNKQEDLKKIFKEYDKKKLGYIKFSEMVEIINKMKLGEIKEEILLFTKSEIFGRMNYCYLLVLAKSADKEENLININNVNTTEEENSIINHNDDNNNENETNKEKEAMFLDKLRNFANSFEEEPEKYLSNLKQPMEINDEEIEGIKVDELLNLFNEKNIELNEDEINLLKNKFNIVNQRCDELDNFISYKNFTTFLKETKIKENKEQF